MNVPHPDGELTPIIDWADEVRRLVETGWYTNNGPKVRLLEQRLADLSRAQHCVCVCTFELSVIGLLLAQKQSGQTLHIDGGVSPVLKRAIDFFELPWQPLPSIVEDAVTKPLPNDTILLDGHAPMDTLRRFVSDCRSAIFLVFHSPIDICAFKLRVDSFGRSISGLFVDTSQGPLVSTGEGGALLTNSQHLANLLRTMRNHHTSETFSPVEVRFNIKMSEFQALRGLLSLNHSASL